MWSRELIFEHNKEIVSFSFPTSYLRQDNNNRAVNNMLSTRLYQLDNIPSWSHVAMRVDKKIKAGLKKAI